MNEINLQKLFCKNNIFFYKEYIDIFIVDKNIQKYLIDTNYVYDSTYKLYNFFNNLINNKKIKINSLIKYNNDSIIRINYKNTNKKNILKKDFRKNGPNNDLIKYAVYHYKKKKDIEFIDFIIENNYDINQFGNNNNNLLLELLSSYNSNIDEHLSLITKIIDKIENINITNKDNKNCLLYCIIYNYFNIFEYIMQTKNVDQLLHHNSCNIFYTIMLFNRVNFFKICLDKININIENFLGENLLMMAIKFKNLNFIELIINTIDINHNNIFGENAILYCFINKYYNILNYIVSKRHKDINYNFISSLIEYDYPNKYNDILFLLEKGANVNKINEANGNIPLQDAILYNDNHIIELLIQYNSNIDHQNHNGYTSLMLAIIMNNLNIINLLISKNCNIYLYSNKNLNALMISYIFNNNNIFKLLIDKYTIFDDCIICLEKKIQNNNLNLLLLWIDKIIKIISSDIIKYYFFKYKKKIILKTLKNKINPDILYYFIVFSQNNKIYLKDKNCLKISHIKYEINNLF